MLHRADPHRHCHDECAHRQQGYDILNQIGHFHLLFVYYSSFVLILFKVKRCPAVLCVHRVARWGNG